METFEDRNKIDRYLDILAAEYKELLLKRLLETSGSIENLSVSELLRIDAEIKRTFLPDYQRRRRRRNLLMITGILYGILGLIFLILNFKFGPDKYDGLELVSLTMVIMSLTSSLLMILERTRNDTVRRRIEKKVEDSKVLSEYQVVKTWREIEGIAADIYSDEKLRPSHSIIARFLEDSYINRIEAEKLREFLKMRNNIVHDTNNNYDTKTITATLKDIDIILSNLKKATI